MQCRMRTNNNNNNKGRDMRALVVCKKGPLATQACFLSELSESKRDEAGQILLFLSLSLNNSTRLFVYIIHCHWALAYNNSSLSRLCPWLLYHSPARCHQVLAFLAQLKLAACNHHQTNTQCSLIDLAINWIEIARLVQLNLCHLPQAALNKSSWRQQLFCLWYKWSNCRRSHLFLVRSLI